METFARFYSRRTEGLEASCIREICKLITRPDIISLAGGWPDPATFPIAEVEELVREVLARDAAFALQYGSSEGLPALRELLARRAVEREGVTLDADQVVITSGNSQAIQLASKTLLDPGDVVVVGSPTYFGATGTFKTFEAQVVGVALDDDGLRTDLLETCLVDLVRQGRRAKLLYVISDFQNPSGATLSMPRRQRLLELARQYDFLILEDNPYSDLRYDGQPLPPLKALDKDERVVYMRSFSKTFAPGLRMAWIGAQRDLVRKIVVVRQYDDACANTLSQYLLYAFIRQGLLDERIRLNIAHYRRKRDHMLALLERYFPPEVRWNRPEGGFFLMVTLPPALDAEVLFQSALQAGVAFVAGRQFYVDGGGRNTLRLSFSQVDDERLEGAIRTLAQVIRAQLP